MRLGSHCGDRKRGFARSAISLVACLTEIGETEVVLNQSILRNAIVIPCDS